MDTETNQEELNEKLRARFKELPAVIQSSITSTDVQKQLRTLADTHRLHLDQWQVLENEVLVTLLGFQPPEELAAHLTTDLDVTNDVAQALAADISRVVFEPIREELERELEHPEAREKEMGDVETAGEQVLANREAPVVSAGPVIEPATPPPPPPEKKTARESAFAGGPASGAYRAGEASAARKDVHDDPYREAP